MLPKVPRRFTRVIEAQLESEGGILYTPSHVAKMIRYQVEDMLFHMRKRYRELYDTKLPIEVAWRE